MVMLSIKPQFDELIARFSDKYKSSAWSSQSAANGGVTPLTSELVNMILSQAILGRASDIHIEPLTGKMRIRYRIDGKLYDVLEIKGTDTNITIIPRLKILASLPTDPASSRKAWDGRFSLELYNQKFDFRIATFPTLLGDKIAIRILNKNAENVELKKIGFNPQDYARLEKIIQRKSGLFIVSGPTGGGKTTTLYSILRRLHSDSVNIVTLEDPVEYQIDGINQCDIKKKGDENFAAGLKAILRQDPDIILFGEIRDLESAEIALRASITGHLVLTSIHANSAIGTIVRLINMGMERHLVAYALIGTLTQRLIRRICDSCKTPHKVDAATLSRMCTQCGLDVRLFAQAAPNAELNLGEGEKTAVPDEFTFYKGIGCDQCGGTGYRGRMAIFELVQFTEDLRDAIIRDASSYVLEEIASRNGFQSLAQDAILKLKAGLVTIDDIYPILLEKSS
jgi:type IV pilus assembly protein PilB